MTSSDQNDEEHLRTYAEQKLASGDPPLSADYAVSPDALGMLYRLAASPDTAHEALKLLHELQVHQVELGLQQEQLAAAEQSATEALAQYQTLFELAPAAYLVLDPNGVIQDVNRAGRRLLEVTGESCIGRALETYLTQESRTEARALFAAPSRVGKPQSCRLQFASPELAAELLVAATPGGESAMVIVSPVEG